MKIVVTGGAGFIGANLCRRLADHPAVSHVQALDDLSTGFRSNLDGVHAELVEGSILDTELVDKCAADAAAIVHLGARPSVPRSVADPVASHLANATGTVNVLEAARNAGGIRVIVASSSSVYGANPTLPKHEDLATRPLSPYAASKLATEAYALAWQQTYDMPVLALRFFNVFGPLQAAGHAYAAVIPAFVDAALRGVPLPVHGDGTQGRDFTYVDTVTEVLAGAAVDGVDHPTPVNLAFGTRTDLLHLIALLEEILGRPLERDHQPTRVGDVKQSQADSSVLLSLFPNLAPVDLETGLLRTVEWFQSLS